MHLIAAVLGARLGVGSKSESSLQWGAKYERGVLDGWEKKSKAGDQGIFEVA